MLNARYPSLYRQPVGCGTGRLLFSGPEPREINATRAAARDPNPRVRRGAAFALNHGRDLGMTHGWTQRSAEMLAELLADPNGDVRLAAADSMARLAGGYARWDAAAAIAHRALSRAFADPDERVAAEAVRGFLRNARTRPTSVERDDLMAFFARPCTPLALARAAAALPRLDEKVVILPWLTTALASGDWPTSLLALEAGAAAGAVARPTTPAVTRALHDSDPVMRRLAARALESMGGFPESTARALRPLGRSDPDEETRRWAVLALVPFDASRGDLARVAAAGRHENAEVRRLAVQQLRSMGANAVPALVRALGDPEVSVWSDAERALAAVAEVGPLIEAVFGPESLTARSRVLELLALKIQGREANRERVAAAVPRLLGLLEKDENRPLLRNALWLLQALGPDARPAVPMLRRVARTDWPESIVARMTLKGLGESRFTLDEIIALLSGAPRPDAGELLDALGRMGSRAEPAVPAILAAAARKPALRLPALEVLGNLGARAGCAVPALTALLHDPSPKIRREAIQTLRRIGPPARLAVPRLFLAIAFDREAPVRVAAIRAAGAITRGTGEAKAALVQALDDPSYLVRRAALLGLESIGLEARDAAPAIRGRLDDPDVRLRVLAREVLKAVGSPEPRPSARSQAAPARPPGSDTIRKDLARLLVEQSRNRIMDSPWSRPVTPAHAAWLALRALTIEESAQTRGAAFTANSRVVPKVWETSDAFGGGYEENLHWSEDGRVLADRSGANIRFWNLDTGRETRQIQLGQACRVCFRPDGTLIAVNEFGTGTVRLLSTATGETRGELRGPSRSLSHLRFSPDGRRLASIGSHRTIRIYDVARRTEERSIPCPGRSTYWTTLAFSADSERVVATDSKQRIYQWDLATGEKRWTRGGPEKAIQAIAASPGGQFVAVASSCLQLLDAETGNLRSEIPVRTIVDQLCFGPREQEIFLHYINQEVAIKRLNPGDPSPLRAGRCSRFLLSPDGKTLATSGIRGLALWDVATGMMKAAIEGHRGSIQAIATSPDEKSVITGSADGTLRLWETATGRPTGLLSTGPRDWGAITAVAVHPDGETVAAGGEKQRLVVWRRTTDGFRCTRWNPGTNVRALVYARDGRTLIAGGDDGVIRVHEADTGKVVARLVGHRGAVWSLALAPDGCTLASGAWDETVRLWRLDTGKAVATLDAHTGDVMSVAFHPEGKVLASAGYDFTIRLWDVQSRRLLRTIPNGPKPPDFPFPYLTTRDWDRRRSRKSSPRVVFSPDGKLLAASAWDPFVRIFDPATGERRAAFFVHQWGVHALAFLRGGRELATGSLGGTLAKWNLEPVRRRDVLRGHHTGVLSLDFDPKGELLVSGDTAGGVYCWDVSSRRLTTVLEGHQRPVGRIDVSPDGRRVASVDWDRIGLVHDVATGQVIHKTPEHPKGANDLAFCGGSARLAIARVFGDVRMMDLDTGRRHERFRRAFGPSLVIAVRPDGAHLAIAHPGADRIVIRDTAMGGILKELEGHGRQRGHLAYSADGRRFASTGDDRIIHVRDGSTYETVARFGPLAGSIDGIALNPDGSLVAVVVGSKLALHDVDSGRKLLVLDGHDSGTLSAAFNPASGDLVTGGGDGTIRFWRLDPSAWNPHLNTLRIRLERETGLQLRGSIVEPAPAETHFTAVPPFRFLPSFERRRIIRVGE